MGRANGGFGTYRSQADVEADRAFMRIVTHRFTRSQLRDKGFPKTTVESWYARGCLPSARTRRKLEEILKQEKNHATT